MLFMVKVKLRGSDRKNIFVTNLPKNFVDSKTIERLYMLRWEVEVYFRDLIQTVHLEQWHSHDEENSQITLKIEIQKSRSSVHISELSDDVEMKKGQPPERTFKEL